MFTNKKAKYYGDNKVLLDSACLSGDTKPTTGVANGSMTLEMDTGKLYAFDEANSEWLALSSGGGGGGGGAEPLVATYNSSTHVLDKTYGEIAQAIENGGIGSVTIKMSDAEHCAIITFMFAYDIYGYSMTVGDGGYMFQEGAETDYPMYISD